MTREQRAVEVEPLLVRQHRGGSFGAGAESGGIAAVAVGGVAVVVGERTRRVALVDSTSADAPVVEVPHVQADEPRGDLTSCPTGLPTGVLIEPVQRGDDGRVRVQPDLGIRRRTLRQVQRLRCGHLGEPGFDLR